MKRFVVVFYVCTSLLTSAIPTFGAWSTDLNVDNVVCAAAGNQTTAAAVPDGFGGVISVWVDHRAGASSHDIYAQRLSADGDAMWTPDGLAICVQDGVQSNPQLLADGSGGAFIVWSDSRPDADWADIYTQHVNAVGEIQWEVDGRLICGYTRNQAFPRLTTDGAGGFIACWQDGRGAFGTYEDVYAQKVDASGVAQWNTDGMVVASESGSERSPRLVAEGSGGAIITFWVGPVIRAQRLSSSGIRQWASQGLLVSSETVNFPGIQICSDGSGGAILNWASAAGLIRAQRIDGMGGLQWNNGDDLPVCDTAGLHSEPRMVSDGVGGAYLTWQDGRNEGNTGVYAQRLDQAGTALWPTDGVPITVEDTYIPYPAIMTDGQGAIITWADTRSGAALYAQRVNPAGIVAWPDNGVPVSTAHSNYINPAIVTDTANGGIMVFRASAANANIYAKRILADGTLGDPVSSAPSPTSTPSPDLLILGQNVPNPFNPVTTISFSLATAGGVELDIITPDGRRVATLVDGQRSAGEHQATWDGRDQAGRRMSSGVYYSRLRSGGQEVTRALTLVK